MTSKGRHPHQCPACGGRTYRRIRRMPIQGLIDARCKHCVDKNFRPETVIPYDLAKEATHGEAVGTRGHSPTYVIFDEVADFDAEAFEQAQTTFFQDPGS